MLTELQQVQQFFNDYNIPFSTEWLESCFEWCKDGNLPPNYSLKDLNEMVFEQWLVLDLRDLEVSSLPMNLSDEKRYSLAGSYYLQMMQVVDISKPKLWQLQRIRNNVAKNTEAEKDFGKRVLQLTLTDGVQKVEAMEFKPISCLNINLRPGTKIRITGPVMVRNGRLMLTEENVKCLGGSVDEIRVEFAAENVLARALRLEENPDPYPIDEKALEVTEANNATQMNTQNFSVINQNQNYQTHQPQNNINLNQNNNRIDQNFYNTNRNVLKTQNTVSNRQDINPPEFQFDDELLRELEADFEENSIRNTIGTRINNRTSNSNINLANAKTNTVNRNTKSKENARSSSPDLFDETEVDDELLNEHLDQIDVDHMASNIRSIGSFRKATTKRLGGSGQSTRSAGDTKFLSDRGKCSVTMNSNKVQDFEISSSGKTTQHDDNDEVIILDDSFEDIDIDLHLDNIDEEMANLPSSTQKRNDLKNRVKSPELRSRRLSSNNPRNFQDVTSTSLTLKKPLITSKKLTQGTLNFGSTKADGKTVLSQQGNLNLSARSSFNSPKADHDNPFSIFKQPSQKSSSCGLSEASKTSVNLPQKPTSIGLPDFESKYLPGTSSTLLNQSPNSLPLSPEVQLTSPPSSSKTAKVLPIEKLKKMLPTIGKGKFKINGKFKTVAEKLQHTDDGYRFVIVVEDTTGDLTVQIHSDLVTNLAGVGPEELGRLRVLALQQDEDVKRQIVQVLSSLHQKCLSLDNVLEIQVTRGEKYPVVINII